MPYPGQVKAALEESRRAGLKYMIVSDDHPEGLEDQVTSFMVRGWLPTGGVFLTPTVDHLRDNIYNQAIVRT